MARTVSASSSSDRGSLLPLPLPLPLLLPPPSRSASIMAANRRSKHASATCFFPFSIFVFGLGGAWMGGDGSVCIMSHVKACMRACVGEGEGRAAFVLRRDT